MRGVRIVSAALPITLLGGTGYAWASYQHLTSGLPQLDAIPGAPGGKDVDGAAQSILLVGDDHRPANASPAELAQLSTGQDGPAGRAERLLHPLRPERPGAEFSIRPPTSGRGPSSAFGSRGDAVPGTARTFTAPARVATFRVFSRRVREWRRSWTGVGRRPWTAISSSS